MALLSQVTFVLHRPHNLDNVGAVARVVKNFGIGRLALVDPPSPSFERARKLAVGAEDILERMSVHPDLEGAIAGAGFIAGTSSRTPRRLVPIDPRELARRVARASGEVAIVFGEERRGLSDDELLPCGAVCRIPTGSEQPSLNLAQSTAVLAYALRAEAPELPDLEVEPEPVRATRRELLAAEAEAQRALSAAGFLNPQRPELILDELTRCWTRAELGPREAELWRNAFRKLADELDRRSRG